MRSEPSARLTASTSARPAATQVVRSGTTTSTPSPGGVSSNHACRLVASRSPVTSRRPSSGAVDEPPGEHPAASGMARTSAAAIDRGAAGRMARRSVPSGDGRRPRTDRRSRHGDQPVPRRRATADERDRDGDGPSPGCCDGERDRGRLLRRPPRPPPPLVASAGARTRRPGPVGVGSANVTASGSPAPTAIGAPGSHGLSEPPSPQVNEPSWPTTASPPSAASDAAGGRADVDGEAVGAAVAAGAAVGVATTEVVGRAVPAVPVGAGVDEPRSQATTARRPRTRAMTTRAGGRLIGTVRSRGGSGRSTGTAGRNSRPRPRRLSATCHR